MVISAVNFKPGIKDALIGLIKNSNYDNAQITIFAFMQQLKESEKAVADELKTPK